MATIRRILCPVDFSEASRHAVECAAAIARWYGASISALHVCSPPFLPVPTLPPPAERVSEAELARVREEAAAHLTSAGASAADILVEVGSPAAHIVSRAAALPADLIVMGTHGASGFEHLVLGSVTEKVLRRVGCPVVTVPPRAHGTGALPFRQRLCAVDLSDSSLAALTLACSLARESKSALTVLHVIEWPWEEPPPPSFAELPAEQGAALADYRRYVETSAVDRLQTLTRDVDTGACQPASRVVHGKAHIEILRLAGEIGADLIVMGVRSRNVTDLALFGSTANQVVRRATCAVLTLRQ